VEDDAKFASVFLELARASGFKGVVALNATTALGLVKELVPDAITLDLNLPDMDGWALLDLIKHDPETRHIPVNVVSVANHVQRCFHMGAFGVVHKPATKEVLQEALARTRRFIERDAKSLLVADGDGRQRENIVEALKSEGVHITEAGTGKEALEALHGGQYECMVIGPKLRDMGAIDLLKKFARTEWADEIPIVMFSADGYNRSERDSLRKLAEVVVLKSVNTPEDVLEETTLFLHQAVESLPRRTRDLLVNRQKTSRQLADKKALIVDDDIRNIFALTSVMEQHGIVVLNAENGKDGIEMLKNNPGIDVVLMDIMMPDLDGYDTIRIIRKLEEFRDLPIIAITARAMKGDREKCIEAGASDYIAKPVESEYLLSMLRAWLHR
jgi:CheY-like chemotaxis protein